MAVRKSVDVVLAELNRMHDEDRRRQEVPVTYCKTCTSSYLQHTRHGVIKIVVTTPIKY